MPFKADINSYYYLTKPGIVYANVFSAVAGYLFASHLSINLYEFSFLIAGITLLIAGSCVANNIADRNIDSKMKRTKQRAVVSGNISIKNAYIFSFILIILGLILLSQTNSLVFILGLIASFSYIFIYTPLKKRSVYSTLIGTLPGGASLAAGYICVTETIDIKVIILFLIMVCWQMVHFYAIGLYRLKDYKSAGLPIWPVVKGIKSTKVQIFGYISFFIILNAVLAVTNKLNILFYILIFPISIYWFNKLLSRSSLNIWAKKVFLTSLVVLLLFNTALIVG